jgi:phosphoenolpyruvate synthase/pyruvate phosphate dikinase
MIKVRLKDFAKRLDKSISDISRDTGLNRNTISDLFNEKVDGIKFETIEKLQKAYDIKMEDILVLEKQKKKKKQEMKIYMQEGALVPFTVWKGVLAIDNMPYEYFGQSFGRMYLYIRDDYFHSYWDLNQMNSITEIIYNRYDTPTKLNKLFKIFYDHAENLKSMYFNCNPRTVLSMDNDELKKYWDQVLFAYEKFWAFGIFIDGFDAGKDFQKIKEISLKFKFNPDEIATLTTPKEISFNNERSLAILEITKKIAKRKFKFEVIDKFLENFVDFDDKILAYKKNFDYYKSNYAEIEHITSEEIVEEIKKYLQNENLLNSEYKRLINSFKNQTLKISRILRKHKLKENPFFFFSKLTYWREYRKQINLMGFHICDAVLSSIELKTGIPKKYLKYLSFEEVENVLKGLISIDMLRERREKGVMIIFEKNTYKILIDTEASSLKRELDDKSKLSDIRNQTIIPGQVASQGYAKGIAKIILDTKDFNKFNDGEVLVSGMTRPEFIPLMKKAIAIVTNEGGITCHAAIVSRELGKPCIIGTKNATEIIKDGDLIEVRANHGTVRILK